MELKTLKDIDSTIDVNGVSDGLSVFVNDLKQEAIKWAKELKNDNEPLNAVGFIKEFFNLNSELVSVDNAVIKNSNPNITGYTVSLYQGSILINSNTSLIDSTDIININQIFDTETINTAYRNAKIKIEVQYGTSHTKEFVRQISISKRTSNPLTYFQGAADDLGQPLAAIIAIFLTGLLLAMLTFSGLPRI